ncbi:MAG: MATE family efflux transporter [Oribacterium sp.]
MAATKKYEMDMTSGAILPKLVLFSLPLIASGILQLLFNAADVVVVGRFVGPQAMAAVGSTASLINLLINFFIGLSVGVNVCVARYYAAGKDTALSETISTAVLTAALSGVLLILLGTALARPMLELMGSPQDVIGDSVRYLRIYFLGMPAVMLYNFISAIFRAVGDTKRPLYFQLAAGIVNVFLNLFFVLGMRIGVAGVAIATSVSQALSAACLLVILTREEGRLHLDLRRLHINRQKLLEIFKVGFPAGLQSTVFSLSNVIIQSAINSFGSIAMAGSTASANIEGFVYISMNSVYQTNLSFCSQNIGAGKYSRINPILYRCLGLVTVIGLVLGLLANLFSSQLFSFYTTDPAVAAYGKERLLIITGPYFLCGAMDTMVGSLRGMGYSFEPMLVSFLGACGTRILYIMTLFRLPFFHTLSWLYIGYPVSWALTLFCHFLTFRIVRRRFPQTDRKDGMA